MQKDKSTNLHDFQHELFLGFIAQQPLQKPEYEISFISGQPLWLYEPNQKLLNCQQCSGQGQQLTFVGQLFCPLNAKQCYNRIMYLFYCEKCKRCFKCLKQQTDQSWQPKQINTQKKYKAISPQSFQIQSDPIQRKQLLKIINRSKIQVQEQIIMQQQDDDQEQGEQVVNTQRMTGQQMMKKLQQLQKAKKNKQYTQKEIQQINRKFELLKMDDKDERQGFRQMQQKKRDQVFQQYVKTMKTINSPVLIYSNIPIPYNKSPLNPRHVCKHCNMKLSLEIQLTEKVLLFHKSLAMLDWGSIFVYTCTGSCQQSQQQCVVSQYEFDAISEEQLSKLRKTKKTRNKNKNKNESLSKEKRRQEQQAKTEVGLIESSKQELQEKQQEGDWD